jgi:Uncharacterized conserved protein
MLDRDGHAEMPASQGSAAVCRGLVKTACSGRPILALDGCAMACVSACLARVGVVPDRHVLLSDHGIRKLKHCDPDPDDVVRLYEAVALQEIAALSASKSPGGVDAE